MAQNVYSVNAVGYANISVPSGFSMIACPFEQTSGDYGLNTLIPAGNAALQDASIYRFVNGRFLPPFSYDQTDGWDTSVNGQYATLPLGEGAFILAPQATTLTFVGQVKQSVGGAPIDNPVPSGFSIRSSMVPQAASLNTLQLFNDGLQDASLYHFNTSTTPKRYDPPATYDATDKWDPDYSLRIGESFFVLSPRATSISRVFTVN
jgi:hypothetical protein